MMGGRIEVVRRGVAQFRVATLTIDGRTVDPRFASRMLRYRTMQRSTTSQVWFELPNRIGELRMSDGTIRALAWPRVGDWNEEPLRR